MNNKKPYFIGLDLGSGSVGWSVIDEDGSLVRAGGKKLWGVRLFEQAKSSLERRTKRRQRRTISKRSWRLLLLRNELASYVLKEDPTFFKRIKKSQEKPDGNYFLFDGKYNDVTYMKEFPTIFHLRYSLTDIENVRKYQKEGRYYRLLYLAISDILKTRGNFLTEGKLSTSESTSVNKILDKLDLFTNNLNEVYELNLNEELINKTIKDILNGVNNFNKRLKDTTTLFIKAIIGDKFDLYKLIPLSEEKLEISFKEDDVELKLTGNDEIDNIIRSLEEIYSSIRLSNILGESTSISQVKIEIFIKHKIELAKLKEDLVKVDMLLETAYYDEIFNQVDKTHGLYSKYVGKSINGNKTKVVKDSKGYLNLIKKLVKIKEELDSKYPENNLLMEVSKEDYLQIPTNKDNRLIPYQIHYNELNDILNQFLVITNNDNAVDIKDRILRIMDFKVPYYVGPLSNLNNKENTNYWLVKNKGFENEKITPFNFEQVVNKKETNEAFIKKMLRSCTYLYEEFCLQQETITYQTFIFYNTINKIKLNDNYITNEQKEVLFESLAKGGSLTKKKILSLLNLKDVEVSGFSRQDDSKQLQISLSSIKNFREIFKGEQNNKFYQEFYDDVINEVSFIDDYEIEVKKDVINKILSNYKTITITEEQLDKLAKVKSAKWGNLSYKLLVEMKFEKENNTGEVASIIEILKYSNLNLMEILNKGDNTERIEKENNLDQNLGSTLNVHEYLKKKYISPQARRTIIQTIRIVDEIVKIMGGRKPLKIAIEFTRESDAPKKETNPRYEQVKEAYKNISKDYKEIKDLLQILEKDKQRDKLKAKKIFLYFMQLGKDMYTGEEINFNELLLNNNSYDIDHIYPQSRIKDDSFDNLVLTHAVVNSKKSNITPLPLEIRQKNIAFWTYLKEHKLISTRKFERLTRSNPLTDQELEDFVNRQKTTLDWINKETADLLKLKYATKDNNHNFIIYSKSQHVTSLRRKFKIVKLRELNNLHHAHDAYLNILVGLEIQKNLFINDEGNFRTYNYERIIERNLSNKVDYIRKIFSFNDVFVTKKTKIENNGMYWDQQVVAPKANGKNESLIPIKNNLDVNKYGGFRKAGTAFFSILENDKGKFIQQIPSYHCDKFYVNNLFDKDLFKKYIKEEYPESKLICDIIPVGQKVLLDNVPLLIASKSKTQIAYHNSTELVLNNKTIEKLKDYFNLYNKYKGKEIPKFEFTNKKITNETNIQIFTEIFNKVDLGANKFNIFNPNIYNRLNFLEYPINNFEKFDFKTQFDSLMTILNSLLKSKKSNQGALFGKSYNDYMKSSNITYKFSIIKESITGFYTKKIDINV